MSDVSGWPTAEPAEVRARLERPFQVVAGKGGVGRTAIASAIALRSARSGARTLLLEVNAPDHAARALGVTPSPDQPRRVLPNLWLCRMTPAGALQEYALSVLRLRALYKLVFENKLVKHLLRALPSLAEVNLAGKAWFHSIEKLPDGRPRFERIIIDAPATGHAVTFLSVSRVVADTVPVGVLRTAAEKMAKLIEAPDSTCLHLVTTPEEMPVNEALDLATAARGSLRMALGVGFVNRMRRPVLRAGEEEIAARLKQQAGEMTRPYLSALTRRLDLEDLQFGHARRFADSSGAPVICLPELPATESFPRITEQLSQELDRAADVSSRDSDG